MGRKFILYLSFLAWLLGLKAVIALEIEIGVYRLDEETFRAPISRLDIPAENDGIAGAEVGLTDNQTTGGFLGQEYKIAPFFGFEDALLKQVEADYARGLRLFILDAPETLLLSLSEAYGDALFFNVSAEENELRNEKCRGNILHIAPSHAQKTDAVIQYLMWKKWPEILLVYGSHEDDAALAESYRASAQKFGANIVEELVFEDTGGARQSDTGYALVQKQIPSFLQNAKGHDVIIAADNHEIFAAYLPYRNWEARPVAGSAGLRTLSWTPALDAWGAEQMQRRFQAHAARYMVESDYNYWLAMRVISEAVTRTNSVDAAVLREYLLSEDFSVAAFKGVPLSFREWNGQLRQSILLSDERLVVSVSPQEGYLHQESELDTLGFDRGESSCQAFE